MTKKKTNRRKVKCVSCAYRTEDYCIATGEALPIDWKYVDFARNCRMYRPKRKSEDI